MFNKALSLFVLLSALAIVVASAAPEADQNSYGLPGLYLRKAGQPHARSFNGPARLPSGQVHKRHERRGIMDKKVFLKVHNDIRLQFDAQLLTWNDTLANYAQLWANHCTFEHSHGPYGENIWSSTGSTPKPAVAGESVKDWASEVKDYDPNNPGFSMETGHFTQVVWAGSRQVGCAVGFCTPEDLDFDSSYGDKAELVVCEYWPPGNFLGKQSFEANVKV